MTAEKGYVRYRWVIAFMLFAATSINYIDRQIFGLLKPELEKVFNWSETDYSRIVMCFTACYSIGLLVYGRFIDIIGSRLGYLIAVSVWSVASMMHAAVNTTMGFAIARAVLGLGESGNYPAGVKTAGEWFPHKERALAIGIMDSGSNIGACVGPLLIPFLLSNYGWRASFIITGALGIFWLIAWWFIYPKKKKIEVLPDVQVEKLPSAEPRVGWGQLLRYKQTWIFIIGKFFTDPIWFFFLFWLPSYFGSTFHLDLRQPGLPLAIVYSGAMIGSIGGGYLSSFLIARGTPVYKARKIALLVSALLVLPILATRFVDNMWVVVLLISLSAAANQAWSANIFAIVPDMFPSRVTSSVVGLGGMIGAIGSLTFPIFIGYILDTYKATGNIVAGYNIIFIVCGSSFMIAWVLIHAVLPKMNRVSFS